jgi:cell division protease FtsH
MKAHELKDQLVVFLAGREAERLILGENEMSTGATDDLRRATGLGLHAIEECGLDPEIGPVSPDPKSSLANHYKGFVAERLEIWLAEAERRCANLLRENEKSLRAAADALCEHESIDGGTFYQLVR